MSGSVHIKQKGGATWDPTAEAPLSPASDIDDSYVSKSSASEKMATSSVKKSSKKEVKEKAKKKAKDKAKESEKKEQVRCKHLTYKIA
jgi:hypothetical protein